MLCCAASPTREAESLVQIKSWDVADQTWNFIGSGVSVFYPLANKNVVLTATHVVADEEVVQACGYRGGLKDLTLDCQLVLATHPVEGTFDTVWLETNLQVAPTAKLNAKGVWLSEHVEVMGFPMGMPTMFEGQVATIYEQYYGVVGGYCSYGISGGPVYDNRGRVVALVHSIPSWDTLLGSIPITSLCYITTISSQGK